MIKIEEAEVVGWDHAIRGMRNPMNSWDKSDSAFGFTVPAFEYNRHIGWWVPVHAANSSENELGPNDKDLMMRLAKNGPVHAKYRRMITVYVDITAPLYWWKEFDTYKVGTVANSCSTMHKIHDKEFELEDFSTEHLTGISLNIFKTVINLLNDYRTDFLNKTDNESKTWWWQMIQLLPSSYNQKRTIMLNYEVLANIYKSRKNHKLDEWRELCEWIERLPHSEIITVE